MGHTYSKTGSSSRVEGVEAVGEKEKKTVTPVPVEASGFESAPVEEINSWYNQDKPEAPEDQEEEDIYGGLEPLEDPRGRGLKIGVFSTRVSLMRSLWLRLLLLWSRRSMLWLLRLRRILWLRLCLISLLLFLWLRSSLISLLLFLWLRSRECLISLLLFLWLRRR